MAFCREKMTLAERNAEKESISKIEAYKKEEKHMFREINKLRAEMRDTGKQVDYSFYETKLQECIVVLKGDLLDIEMALQQALEQARSQFFN